MMLAVVFLGQDTVAETLWPDGGSNEARPAAKPVLFSDDNRYLLRGTQGFEGPGASGERKQRGGFESVGRW